MLLSYNIYSVCNVILHDAALPVLFLILTRGQWSSLVDGPTRQTWQSMPSPPKLPCTVPRDGSKISRLSDQGDTTTPAPASCQEGEGWDDITRNSHVRWYTCWEYKWALDFIFRCSLLAEAMDGMDGLMGEVTGMTLQIYLTLLWEAGPLLNPNFHDQWMDWEQLTSMIVCLFLVLTS